MSHDVNNPGAAHGSFKQYTIGFILSIILTLIPFGMVMAGMTGGLVVATIAITAIAQVTALGFDCLYLYHFDHCDLVDWFGMGNDQPTCEHDDLNACHV